MKIRQLFGLLLLILAIGLTGCAPTTNTATQLSSSQPDNRKTLPQETVSLDEVEIVTGQIIFAPAYSEIFFFDEERTSSFAVTLAIHNTDPNHPIIITSIRYYDTNGNLVEAYVETPRKLNPLAKAGIVVPQRDTRGGVGANFIVEWVAETPVYAPVVETVMISESGTRGLSLISPGRVLSEIP